MREFYLAFKNEILMYSLIRINLENTTLSEIEQSKLADTVLYLSDISTAVIFIENTENRVVVTRGWHEGR